MLWVTPHNGLFYIRLTHSYMKTSNEANSLMSCFLHRDEKKNPPLLFSVSSRVWRMIMCVSLFRGVLERPSCRQYGGEGGETKQRTAWEPISTTLPSFGASPLQSMLFRSRFFFLFLLLLLLNDSMDSVTNNGFVVALVWAQRGSGQRWCLRVCRASHLSSLIALCQACMISSS